MVFINSSNQTLNHHLPPYIFTLPYINFTLFSHYCHGFSSHTPFLIQLRVWSLERSYSRDRSSNKIYFKKRNKSTAAVMFCTLHYLSKSSSKSTRNVDMPLFLYFIQYYDTTNILTKMEKNCLPAFCVPK